jgi:hypothetical protein
LINWIDATETMKTVANSETTAAQNASAVFILKEQNGGANGAVSPSVKSSGAVSPSVKSSGFKRNGVRSEEQENNGQVSNQKFATLPAGISDSKKKIAVAQKGKTHLTSVKPHPVLSRSVYLCYLFL